MAALALLLIILLFKIEGKKYDIVEITGCSEHIDCMVNSVKALLPDGEGIKISIEEDYPSHIGLGSGTHALAAGMAVNELYGLDLNIHDIAVKVGAGRNKRHWCCRF